MKKILSSSFYTTFSVLFVGIISIICSYFLLQIDITKHNPYNAIIASVTPSVVLILQDNVVIGAGVIVDSQKGLILTSKHLVTPTSQIMIQDTREIYSIIHFYPDTERDLALVQVIPNTSFSLLPSAQFIPTINKLEKGDSVLAFGALPISQSIALSQGIISDVHQKIVTNESKTNFTYFIQTDVGAVDGFSGGPLVNREWLVIGVNSAVFGFSNRISWSTPVTKDILNKLIKNKIEHGFFSSNT